MLLEGLILYCLQVDNGYVRIVHYMKLGVLMLSSIKLIPEGIQYGILRHMIYMAVLVWLLGYLRIK